MGLWEDTIDYGYILGCNILKGGGGGVIDHFRNKNKMVLLHLFAEGFTVIDMSTGASPSPSPRLPLEGRGWGWGDVCLCGNTGTMSLQYRCILCESGDNTFPHQRDH